MASYASPLILAAPFKTDHRLNGLCIAFAISFPTRSWTDGSDMYAGSVRRSNSRRRSASSSDILLTDLARSWFIVTLLAWQPGGRAVTGRLSWCSLGGSAHGRSDVLESLPCDCQEAEIAGSSVIGEWAISLSCIGKF
jgi:hypothetical protein